MKTGLERYEDSVIETIILNLKSGLISVLDMSKEELHFSNGKDASPAQAVQLNFMLLETFRAEAYRRGINYDSIGMNTNEIEDAWLEKRTKE